MQEKTTWQLSCFAGGAPITVQVKAIDPRDAMSRGLTTTRPSGRLLGEELGLPVQLLANIPCDDATKARVIVHRIELLVEQVAESHDSEHLEA